MLLPPCGVDTTHANTNVHNPRQSSCSSGLYRAPHKHSRWMQSTEPVTIIAPTHALRHPHSPCIPDCTPQLPQPPVCAIPSLVQEVEWLPSEPVTFWFARHGQSEYNVEDRIGGDSSITAKGQRFADALPGLFGRVLKAAGEDPRFITVWTSTLLRTIQTASKLPLPQVRPRPSATPRRVPCLRPPPPDSAPHQRQNPVGRAEARPRCAILPARQPMNAQISGPPWPPCMIPSALPYRRQAHEGPAPLNPPGSAAGLYRADRAQRPSATARKVKARMGACDAAPAECRFI